MPTLTVSETMHIARPADVVRRQFADVHHHQVASVHKGVAFEVRELTNDRCSYRQTTRVGPLRLRQELELHLTADGPLVNTITKGQFTGGSITFTFTPEGTDATLVDAHLQAPTNMLQTLAAPLLRAHVAKALRQALAEDKADLESGAYRR